MDRLDGMGAGAVIALIVIGRRGNGKKRLSCGGDWWVRD